MLNDPLKVHLHSNLGPISRTKTRVSLIMRSLEAARMQSNAKPQRQLACGLRLSPVSNLVSVS